MNSYKFKQNIYDGSTSGFWIGCFVSIFPLCIELISAKNLYNVRLAVVSYPINVMNIISLGAIYGIVNNITDESFKLVHAKEGIELIRIDVEYFSKYFINKIIT